MSQLWSDRQ